MMMGDQLAAKKKRETPHSISKMEDVLDIPTSNKLRNHMFWEFKFLAFETIPFEEALNPNLTLVFEDQQFGTCMKTN